MTKSQRRQLALDLIVTTEGEIFSCVFVKRTTGEIRKIVARLGVKSHLKGGTQTYDPKKYNLLTVFDMDKRSYRMIDLDGVIEVTVGGEVHELPPFHECSDAAADAPRTRGGNADGTLVSANMNIAF